MAGIEKICELSGDYPAHLMYGYKHNHIQIDKKYRHLFNGKKATLVFYKPTQVIMSKSGSYSHFNEKRLEWDDSMVMHNNRLYKWVTNRKYPWMQWARYQRLTNEHQYCLIVDDPELQGRLQGHYMNWSFDKFAVIKKLTKLVGAGNLTVINKTDTEFDYPKCADDSGFTLTEIIDIASHKL